MPSWMLSSAAHDTLTEDVACVAARQRSVCALPVVIASKQSMQCIRGSP